MGIGRIGNTGLSEGADVPLVLLDLLVPVGQVQDDRILVVYAGVPKSVYLQSGFLEQLAPADEVVVMRMGAVCPEDNVFHPYLPGELQVLLARFRGDLCSDLDSGLYGGDGAFRFHLSTLLYMIETQITRSIQARHN